MYDIYVSNPNEGLGFKNLTEKLFIFILFYFFPIWKRRDILVWK